VEYAEEGPPDAIPDQQSDLRILVVLAGSLRGEMSFRIPQTVALATAQLFLGETRDNTVEFTNDQREALEELLRQVGGHAATALKSHWGEVQLRLESSTPPTWSAAATGWLNTTPEAPHRVWMEWQLSAALHTALSAVQTPAAVRAGEVPVGTGVPNAAASVSTPTSAQEGKLGLFMDVELGVSLRFGCRRMLLREILELSSGSVVELDRQVQEPADLLLDGKLIARGEVVVVDGSYGLRVIEVISP
jgi:flagellar motor switch protein FliN/FliY